MSARVPIGIVMNGVTGRMGYRQHLVRSLLAIREAGGLPLADGSTLWPELVLVGRNEAKLRDVADRHGLTDYTTDLDAALARDDVRIYFDAQVTSEREKAIGLADRGRQAHLHREADLDHAQRRDRAGPGGRRRRGQARGGAGQAVPARPAQAAAADRGRLLRPDPVGARRVRLLGVRGGLAERAAAQLELPRPGRRRHRGRHVPALALRAGADLRAGARGHRARDHAHPAAVGREGRAVRGDRRRLRVRHLRIGRWHRRADQLVLGGPGEPRRAGRVPGGRHRGQRGGRAARLPHPAPGRHPQAGVEPGPAGQRPVPGAVAGGPGQRGVRQRLQGPVGDVPAARGRGRPVHLGSVGRRPRRATGRAGPAVGPRGPPHRDPGAGA